MKDTSDSTAVSRAPERISPAEDGSKFDGGAERDGFSNRKLIRPSLSRGERPERTERGGERAERLPSPTAKKNAPPDQTYAENFYYQKQMQSRTPMVIVLSDGEEMRGVIEWYDKTCIKVNRSGHQSNLMIYKASIKYIFKESEANGRK